MSKLSSLSNAATYKPNFPKEEKLAFRNGFEEGFETAFKVIKEELAVEIKKVQQYPMMGERIYALKLYMDKMDKMLEEMKSNEY
jgi:hypothetical protein